MSDAGWVYVDERGTEIRVTVLRFQGGKTRVRLGTSGEEILIDTNRLSRIGKRRTR